MNREAINRLDVLQGLLRAALHVSAMKHQFFPTGWLTPDEVIVTHRFIIIREGAMDYTVEGRTRRVTAGTQLFVPAWCRRKWKVPQSVDTCRLLWCEFSSAGMNVPEVLWWRELALPAEEVGAFERMRTQDDLGNARVTLLRQEGELKACLARFWLGAQTVRSAGEREPVTHPEVTRAMAWLERHFGEADALEAFYRTVVLSQNHFRLLFKRQTGETVQAVLARLRLRRARYLVQETSRSMKQIAAETGFGDPLYFSNQYRKFWGRPATEDRRGGGLA